MADWKCIQDRSDGLSVEALHGNLGRPQEVLEVSNPNVSKSQADKRMKQARYNIIGNGGGAGNKRCMTHLQALRIKLNRNTVTSNIT